MWGAQARKTPEQLCWDPAGTPMGHMPLGSPGVQHRQLTDFGNTAHLSWNHEGASGFFPQRGAGPGGGLRRRLSPALLLHLARVHIEEG